MSLAFFTPCEGHIPHMNDENTQSLGAWRLTSHFLTWHGVWAVTGLKCIVTVRCQPTHYSANTPFTPVPFKMTSSVQYRSDQGGTRYYTMRVVAEPATTPPLWTIYLFHGLKTLSCGKNKAPSSLRDQKNPAIGSNCHPTPTPSATAAHGTQLPSPDQTRYSSTDAR